MKYLKFLFYKRSWAVIVNLFILAFLTVGLPTFNSDGSWEVNNLWDIEELWVKVFLGIFIIGVGISALLQVNNEFKNN